MINAVQSPFQPLCPLLHSPTLGLETRDLLTVLRERGVVDAAGWGKEDFPFPELPELERVQVEALSQLLNKRLIVQVEGFELSITLYEMFFHLLKEGDIKISLVGGFLPLILGVSWFKKAASLLGVVLSEEAARDIEAAKPDIDFRIYSSEAPEVLAEKVVSWLANQLPKSLGSHGWRCDRVRAQGGAFDAYHPLFSLKRGAIENEVFLLSLQSIDIAIGRVMQNTALVGSQDLELNLTSLWTSEGSPTLKFEGQRLGGWQGVIDTLGRWIHFHTFSFKAWLKALSKLSLGWRMMESMPAELCDHINRAMQDRRWANQLYQFVQKHHYDDPKAHLALLLHASQSLSRAGFPQRKICSFTQEVDLPCDIHLAAWQLLLSLQNLPVTPYEEGEALLVASRPYTLQVVLEPEKAVRTLLFLPYQEDHILKTVAGWLHKELSKVCLVKRPPNEALEKAGLVLLESGNLGNLGNLQGLGLLLLYCFGHKKILFYASEALFYLPERLRDDLASKLMPGASLDYTSPSHLIASWNEALVKRGNPELACEIALAKGENATAALLPHLTADFSLPLLIQTAKRYKCISTYQHFKTICALINPRKEEIVAVVDAAVFIAERVEEPIEALILLWQNSSLQAACNLLILATRRGVVTDTELWIRLASFIFQNSTLENLARLWQAGKPLKVWGRVRRERPPEYLAPWLSAISEPTLKREVYEWAKSKKWAITCSLPSELPVSPHDDLKVQLARLAERPDLLPLAKKVLGHPKVQDFCSEESLKTLFIRVLDCARDRGDAQLMTFLLELYFKKLFPQPDQKFVKHLLEVLNENCHVDTPRSLIQEIQTHQATLFQTFQSFEVCQFLACCTKRHIELQPTREIFAEIIYPAILRLVTERALDLTQRTVLKECLIHFKPHRGIEAVLHLKLTFGVLEYLSSSGNMREAAPWMDRLLEIITTHPHFFDSTLYSHLSRWMEAFAEFASISFSKNLLLCLESVFPEGSEQLLSLLLAQPARFINQEAAEAARILLLPGCVRILESPTPLLSQKIDLILDKLFMERNMLGAALMEKLPSISPADLEKRLGQVSRIHEAAYFDPLWNCFKPRLEVLLEEDPNLHLNIWLLSLEFFGPLAREREDFPEILAFLLRILDGSQYDGRHIKKWVKILQMGVFFCKTPSLLSQLLRARGEIKEAGYFTLLKEVDKTLIVRFSFLQNPTAFSTACQLHREWVDHDDRQACIDLFTLIYQNSGQIWDDNQELCYSELNRTQQLIFSKEWSNINPKYLFQAVLEHPSVKHLKKGRLTLIDHYKLRVLESRAFTNRPTSFVARLYIPTQARIRTIRIAGYILMVLGAAVYIWTRNIRKTS